MWDQEQYYQIIEEAARYIEARMTVRPRVALVLGSGWDGLLDSLEQFARIPYGDVPGMSASSVQGHAGEWVSGQLNGTPVAVMNGRLHYYEGHDIKRVTLPVRVMKRLGVEKLIVTNAAGAINTGYAPGDMMLIEDHINLTGINPLTGPNDERLGVRFPDMSRAYDEALLCLARQVAQGQGINVRQGVYAFMTGPCFETPAEIRALRALGADAVGMSTVPEVTAARHAGIDVLGISLLTNMAAGVLDQPLSHAEVLETAARVKTRFKAFMYELVGRM